MTGVDPAAESGPPPTGEATPAAAQSGPELVIANEFATVIVRRVQTRNGMRLEIDVPASGRSIRLDPLVLESLTWADSLTLGRALEAPFGPEEAPASREGNDDAGDRT